MKIKFFLPFLFITLFALVVFVPTPAEAEEITIPYIFDSTKPISPDVRNALNAWLAESPPSSAVYYAVTYTRFDGVDTHVSLAGLNLSSPDDEWSITGDELGNTQAVWLGTVRVSPDWTVHLKTPTEYAFEGRNKMPFFAMPAPGAGGGSYVRFPWQPSKAVQYGILGVHDVGYSQSGGWVAVDLVSGSDMGSGAANDAVYASAAGQIDYVCDDGQTTAVRLSGGGDYFLYAHLLPNAMLEEGSSFQAGAVLGTLKHGSFVSQGCGHAIQQADHWHLHWGFVTSNNSFQAEGCILQGVGPTASWMCGNTRINVLGYLYHYGNIGVDPNNGTVGVHLPGDVGSPSFWDYFLDGVRNVLGALFVDKLQPHNSATSQLVNPMINSVKIIMRIVIVLIRGNLNLAPAAVVVVLAIGFKLLLQAVMFAGYIIRILKSIPLVP